MATNNTLAADVQRRAKALEDWAISVIDNTTKRSPEAEIALRRHGTKGLRGRAFTLMVGESDVTAALIVHGCIEGVLISKNEAVRTLILTPTNPVCLDVRGPKDAVLGYDQDVHANRDTGWVLATSDSNMDASIANDDKPVVTLTIE